MDYKVWLSSVLICVPYLNLNIIDYQSCNNFKDYFINIILEICKKLLLTKCCLSNNICASDMENKQSLPIDW